MLDSDTGLILNSAAGAMAGQVLIATAGVGTHDERCAW
jgi:hypothetical protein